MMASPYLPLDLVMDNILPRLPVKSLMRFKCVCKSWLSLFETSTFINQHLNRFTLNTTTGGANLLVERCHRTFYLVSGDTFEVSRILDLPYSKKHKHEVLEMMGCCHGIICLCDKLYKELVLWNPATREVKSLPKSSIPYPPGTIFKGCDFGFGFDARTNDYKVVRVVYLLSKNDNIWANQHVEIYSSSTDSWRLIDAVMPVSITKFFHPKTFLNGIYYWWPKYGLDHEGIFLSFDMSDEVFRRIPLPDVCATSDYDRYSRRFAYLNGCIGLILFTIKAERWFEIWVLNEYGAKESWTKLYSIGTPFGLWWPLGFLRNGEMFLKNSDGKLVLCHPFTQEIKYLQLDEKAGSFQVLVYKESLVSLKSVSGPAEKTG